LHLVYIALGSNLGNRAGNLQAAIEALEPEVHSLKCSAVYETPPWGYSDQPQFLNQVIEAETNLTPIALLDYLKKIEVQLGRQETFRFGPRIIDLDIIFYDSEVIDSPPLIIPHPRLAERGFVLMPLADLAPDFRHPILGDSVTDLLSKVETDGIFRVSPEGGGEVSE
jgi:2-amino-4-hydroxy-6-hydroxymethyldihydropteridine diphosphokinase